MVMQYAGTQIPYTPFNPTCEKQCYVKCELAGSHQNRLVHLRYKAEVIECVPHGLVKIRYWVKKAGCLRARIDTVERRLLERRRS